jgi:hypothetical protein
VLDQLVLVDGGEAVQPAEGVLEANIVVGRLRDFYRLFQRRQRLLSESVEFRDFAWRGWLPNKIDFKRFLLTCG